MADLSGFGASMGPGRWAELVELGVPRTYEPDETLMREGDEGHAVHVLVSGRVKVRIARSERGEVPSAVRFPGEVLGDIAVYSGGRRTATVVAIDRCVVRVVAAADFRRFIEDNALGWLVARHFMNRAQEAERHWTELAVVPLPQRMCRTILRFAADDREGRRVLDLNMSQEEFGRMCGASRNAVGEVLRQLRERAIVETQWRSMVVLDVPALERYANGDIPGD
ncbi:Crp/Fnr family transcriptional regulator [Saccharopolyspora taberi]|uniref:Crp/Fnr family transcriptional regulator n=1 Tax=Saccharopolyspora taberi TaxID=60895 RepID=A0ABN3VG36_9PSEU